MQILGAILINYPTRDSGDWPFRNSEYRNDFSVWDVVGEQSADFPYIIWGQLADNLRDDCRAGDQITIPTVSSFGMHVSHIIGVRAEPQVTESGTSDAANDIDTRIVIPYTMTHIARMQHIKTGGDRLAGCQRPCIAVSADPVPIDQESAVTAAFFQRPDPPLTRSSLMGPGDKLLRQGAEAWILAASKPSVSVCTHATATAAQERGMIRWHWGDPPGIPDDEPRPSLAAPGVYLRSIPVAGV
jgi:hypothetical protein